MHVEMTRDAAAFLAVAGEHLAEDPLVGTVLLGTAGREARRARQRPGDPVPDEVRWFATVLDGPANGGPAGGAGAVLGAAMRTAPFEPYPAYVTPMPEPAARALADAVAGLDEHPGGVNGSLPAARVVADRLAPLLGEEVQVDERHRLHELGELTMPPAPAGRLRPATGDDLELCLAWLRRFDEEAAEQAGREPSRSGNHWTSATVRDRIAEGRTWLWEDADGRPVHLTGASATEGGVARIAPVYTPPAERARGYAGRAVAEVSARLRREGARVCLFTDLANPTSNALYARIGFVPGPEIALHRLVRRGTPAAAPLGEPSGTGEGGPGP